MNRLLMAAARGARVQFYGQYGDRHTWAEITRIPLEEAGRVYYRIHPDDAHHEYGPVSAAFREQAESAPGDALLTVYRLWPMETGAITKNTQMTSTAPCSC